MLNITLKKVNFSLLYLIVIGEVIFSLPFHITRFFRPSIIEEYNYSNTMLGVAFSVYGTTALLCYLPGGYIADKFLPKYILFCSLLLTSLGGLFFLLNPNFLGLCIIYGFWGVTTILFFWAALIKATREIAGNRQGFSFGLLEGGRGLVASICASIAVIVYSSDIFVDFFSNLFDKKISSLSVVIFFYSLITFLASLMILFFFKDTKVKKPLKKKKISISSIVVNLKPILCISIIVLSAYTGYKGIDYYSLFFYEILNYSKEKSALVITNLSYLRPISAILAGIIADKVSSKLSSKFMFILLIISYGFLSFINLNNIIYFLLFSTFIISMLAVFAMRGIFYSLLKETKIPNTITGISVGIISLIGYFPDVYVGPIFGYFLDQSKGLESFQSCFLFLLVIALLGLLASLFVPKKI